MLMIEVLPQQTRYNSLQLSPVALKAGLCNAIQPVVILYGSGMMLQLFAGLSTIY